jgi:hypothetical protein
VEYQQMEQRVRLDLPTLSDPLVRDLLQESELFTRSFHGMGGFGLLSPFDLMHILSLFTEVLSHIWVVLSLTGSSTHCGILLFSIFSTLLPFVVSWLGISWPLHSNSLYTPREARAAERQERMRNLVYSDSHRPEILLFGLGPWIMNSWAAARKLMLASEQPTFQELGWPLSLLSNVNLSDFLFVLQNVCYLTARESSSFSKDRLDPLGFDVAVFVDVTWGLHVVPRLGPIRGVRSEKSCDHDTYGISRYYLLRYTSRCVDL